MQFKVIGSKIKMIVSCNMVDKSIMLDVSIK